MSDELKPLACPFCGGEASGEGSVRYTADHEAWFADGTRIREAFFANCLSCGATNKGMIGHQTKAKAIEHWNRRADADRIAGLEAQLADCRAALSAMAHDRDECMAGSQRELAEAKAEVERRATDFRIAREQVVVIRADRDAVLGQRDAIAQRLAKWRDCAVELKPYVDAYLASANQVEGATWGISNAIAAFERLQNEEPKS